MKAQSGFTLVEALVSGLLSTLVAGATYSLLHMSSTQMKDGVGKMRLTQISTAVSDEIRYMARLATLVKAHSDPMTKDDVTYPMDTTTAPDFHHSVVFCNRGGDTLGGYRFLWTGHLQELVDPTPIVPGGDWDWINMGFAEDTVYVDSLRSDFSILQHRRGIHFKLYFKNQAGDSLQAVNETVLCRNPYR